MPSSLSGRVAIVTGSTRGVGLATAKERAENNNATFIVCSRSKERAVELAKEIIGNAFAIWLDVTSDSAKVIAWVVSNNFSFSMGNTIIVDGGTVLL